MQKEKTTTLVPKKLTLNDLKNVAGGVGAETNAIKGEDSGGNKVEISEN